MEFLNEAVRQFFVFFSHYPVQMLIAECLFCFFTPKRKMFYLRLIPLSVLLCALPYIFSVLRKNVDGRRLVYVQFFVLFCRFYGDNMVFV